MIIHIAYFIESFEGFIDNSEEFTFGNFKMQLVEPMRIWRIWYNGVLR